MKVMNFQKSVNKIDKKQKNYLLDSFLIEFILFKRIICKKKKKK